MGTEEKVIFGLLAAVLIGVLVFKVRPDLLPSNPSTENIVGASIAPEPGNTDGPWYLTAAMPYLFGPPVSMYLPGITEGQLGQSDVATLENADSGFLPPDKQWFTT